MSKKATFWLVLVALFAGVIVLVNTALIAVGDAHASSQSSSTRQQAMDHYSSTRKWYEPKATDCEIAPKSVAYRGRGAELKSTAYVKTRTWWGKDGVAEAEVTTVTESRWGKTKKTHTHVE